MFTTEVTAQIAERVAASLARSDETIASLSRKTDIPRTTLNRKLRGSGEFTATELRRISTVLDVRASYLLGESIAA